jgi:epoxide hydrolase-like predicted phosphatase
MIKAALFDYGGVLTTAGGPGDVEREVAGHFGIEPEKVLIDDISQQLRRGEIVSDEFFEELNRRYPSDNRFTQQLFLGAKDELGSRAMKVNELAVKLRQQRVQTGILSNVFEMNANVLRELGCYDGFDPVVLSCEVKKAKPDPEIYELAVETLGVLSEEVLFIDDDPKNLEPAKAIGMLTVQAFSETQLVNTISELLYRINGIDTRI